MLEIETFDAFPVGAAPLLIDDAWMASPELALVDPELADRLRSAPEGPERWESRSGEFEVAKPHLAVVIAQEEPSPTGSTPLPDADVLENADFESADEAQAFAAYPTLPVSQEPDEDHETDAFLRNIEAAPAPADPLLDDLADLIVYESAPPFDGEHMELAEEGPEGLSEAEAVNDYPALPTSGELDATIEETDATLRRMREHLTSDEPSKRPRRVSRFVTVSAGICAIGAVAVFAVDTELGLATLPGRLGF